MDQLCIRKLELLPSMSQKIILATDKPNGYWQITYSLKGKPLWEYFIAVNQMEIEPEILFPNSGAIFVGVEQALFCFAKDTGNIISSVTDLTFVQSIELLSKNRILVAAEDEILVFTVCGILEWRLNLPDILQDVKEVADNLEIELYSGEKLVVNIETSKLVRVS